MGNKTRDEAFDGILGKIRKNPLEWDDDAGHYAASVKLSKKQESVLDNHYEDFNDNGLAGWSRGSDGNTNFYYNIDD